MTLRLGLLHSTIRGDEKLIIKAAADRGVKLELVDIRHQVFSPGYKPRFDLALQRSVSAVKGEYATLFLESIGVKVVNNSQVSRICQDKFITSLTLSQHQVPTPPFSLVFSLEQALEFVERLGGFPIVIKPARGSWGRLMAKVNDREALEAIIEHKQFITSAYQKAFYLQAYVDKKGRDIRAFVINHQVVAAIYRTSKHWITNTARGGVASNCRIDDDLRLICQQASRAVGGGILAMDVFETDDGYVINEINHTMEFKNSEKPTGVSISGAIIDYCLSTAYE